MKPDDYDRGMLIGLGIVIVFALFVIGVMHHMF